VDLLTAYARQPFEELLRILLDLELAGAAVQLPGKLFVRQP